MHLGRLATLRAVADRGTIAAAAQALYVSPSAVSQQLAALEREVGQRLLEPDGRTVRLTSVAAVLVRHADTIFAEVELARAEVEAHVAGESAQLRVGAFTTALKALVAPVAATLHTTNPGVELIVQEAGGRQALDALARQELDLVIGVEGPGAPKRKDSRFTRVELMRDPFDVAVPCDHPLAVAKSIDMCDLVDQPWVAPLAGWSCEQVVLAACHAAGFSPTIVHRSSDWSAVIALVEAHLGVALVPRLARAIPSRQAVVRPLAHQAPCRHLFAACRRGSEAAPAIGVVIERLERQARVCAQA